MAYVANDYIVPDYVEPDDLAPSGMDIPVTYDTMDVSYTYTDLVNATSVTFNDRKLLQ